jgi:ABC-type Fe3+/spermidine/putrescine transport system ATPase subunit
VTDALSQVNMTAHRDRRVTDLSGGEQQRVALARALAPRPRLLMLDEPLGALDYNLREQLMAELRDVLRSGDIPAIYVTHDHVEAFTVADRLVLLHNGRVEQEGDPQAIHACPVSSSAARFFGLGNVLAGEVVGSDPLEVKTPLGHLQAVARPEESFLPGQPAAVLLRFGAARQLKNDHSEEFNCLRAKVVDRIFRGEDCRVVLQCENNLKLQFDLDRPPEIGASITLFLEPQCVLCLPPDHEENPTK